MGLLEGDRRLTQRAGRYWAEIATSLARAVRSGGPEEEPVFQRALQEVRALRKVDLAGFRAFAATLLGPGSRRLLVSEVSSPMAPVHSPQDFRARGWQEVDPQEFAAQQRPFTY